MSDKRCSTCSFWQADDPTVVYRADCALKELTRPEEWQCCSRWATRTGGKVYEGPAQQQSSCRSAWGAYWGLKP